MIRYIPHSKTDNQTLTPSIITPIFIQDLTIFLSKLQNSSKILAWNTNLSRNSKKPFLYTGIGGYLFVIIRIIESEKILEKIKKNLNLEKNYFFEIGLKLEKLIWENFVKYDNNDFSYFLGKTGLVILSIKFNFYLKNEKKIFFYFEKIFEIFENFENEEIEYEVLYGVSGFLIALLDISDFLNKNLKNTKIFFEFNKKLNSSIIYLFEKILEKGISNFKNSKKKNFRLLFLFCKKEYLGAAYGLLGILFSLLLFLQKKKNLFLKLKKKKIYFKAIFDSLYFCSFFQNEEGNFFSSTNSKNDILIQFCHGAIGAVFTFLLANQIKKNFSDFLNENFSNFLKKNEYFIDYLKIAEKSAEIIYKKGILKKGFNLCHGISGNCYAFLFFLKFDFIEKKKKLEFFQKALKFLNIKTNKKFSENFQNLKNGRGDFIYSLMEGLAGDICLECDMIEGNYRFPCFDI